MNKFMVQIGYNNFKFLISEISKNLTIFIGSNLSMKGELDKAKNNLKFMSIVTIVYGCALFTVGFINLVAADTAAKFEDRHLLSFSAPIQIVLGGMALLAALMNSSAEDLNLS